MRLDRPQRVKSMSVSDRKICLCHLSIMYNPLGHQSTHLHIIHKLDPNTIFISIDGIAKTRLPRRVNIRYGTHIMYKPYLYCWTCQMDWKENGVYKAVVSKQRLSADCVCQGISGDGGRRHELSMITVKYNYNACLVSASATVESGRHAWCGSLTN